MMIVDLFIWYVGVHVGNSVGTVVQPLWLQPGGKSPGGGKMEPAGAGLHVVGPGVHSGAGGAYGGSAAALAPARTARSMAIFAAGGRGEGSVE